jgi:drug/metabolite transporter (DMT)-like permease
LKKIEKKDLKLFILLAFFEPYLYFIGETYGLTLVKPSLAAVIVATIPVFAPFFAYFFLREQVTLLNIVGILISVAGVFLMVNSMSNGESNSVRGILLMFLAVISAIIYGLILRKIPSTYSSTNIIFYQNAFGLIFFIPTFFVVDFKNLSQISIHVQSVESVLLLSIFASTVAFVLFAEVVRAIGIAKSEVFTNLIPVFTAFLSWIFLKDAMNLMQWIGVFVVILGVFVSQSKIKRKRRTN